MSGSIHNRQLKRQFESGHPVLEAEKNEQYGDSKSKPTGLEINEWPLGMLHLLV